MRGLLNAALRRAGVRRVLLLEREIHERGPMPSCDLELEVRALEPGEMPAYIYARRPSKRFDPTRLGHGSACYVAWHQGKIVSASWWDSGEAWIQELGRRFELDADMVCSYDAWTVPELRGRNVSPARGELTARILWAQGFRRAFSWVHPDNIPSRRSQAKMGWKPIGRAGAVRIGPARLEFLRVRGRGSWSLRRESSVARTREDAELEPALRRPAPHS